MAALDFPNSPTLNQQYAAPNGVTYQWDSAAWIVTGGVSGPPTGPAGGSLAGTYPNPSIAAQAVRGTPSSGGTAREILKASIWGGDDLIDVSVPWAKLNLQSYARVSRTANYASVPNATFTVLTFDTIESNVGGLYTAGSPDRFTVAVAGYYIFGASLQWGSSTGGARRMLVINVGAGQVTGNETAAGALRNVEAMTGGVLPAGTTVQAYGYQDSGAALAIQGPQNFWIARVA